MSNKLKKNPSPKLKRLSDPIFNCEVPKDAIFFGFKYITRKKEYDFSKSKHKGNLSDDFSKIFEKLTFISSQSWTELQSLDKRKGFETIPLSSFKVDITDQLKGKPITGDTKLLVFRFGDRRLIGYKSNRCKAAIHILGCDWDYSLYDHGS